MALREKIRQLIYVPQLSGGRRTFLHFYWNGYAWSLRDFSVPGVVPKPLYQADLGLSVDEILALARAPGAFCIYAPERRISDVTFWHETTVAANRTHLGVPPDTAATSAVTSGSAPPPARLAPHPVGIEPNTYQDGLRAAFWRYRAQEFAGDDNLFDDSYQPGRAQPPVFKPEHAHRNVLLRPDATRDEVEAVLSAIPAGAHHKWFRSMTSSQALAQSVFANLKYHDKLGLLADLRGGEGLPPFPPELVRPRYSREAAQLELEHHVTTLGEPRPTSVDAMFDGKYRVAVECKLSEPEVGSCSRPDLAPSDSNYESDHCDGTYTHQRGRRDRCALTERSIAYWQYIPKLLTWRADSDMQPCPLRSTYQLVRNILAACVRPNGDLDPAGHAVLLYDARNPAFGDGGKGYLAWQAVRSALKNPMQLRSCTWQELVACLRRDDQLNWLTEALRSKYGF